MIKSEVKRKVSREIATKIPTAQRNHEEEYTAGFDSSKNGVTTNSLNPSTNKLDRMSSPLVATLKNRGQHASDSK